MEQNSGEQRKSVNYEDFKLEPKNRYNIYHSLDLEQNDKQKGGLKVPKKKCSNRNTTVSVHLLIVVKSK